MAQLPTQPVVIYPDSDGQPMADNTKQFRWIVMIQQNLEWLFANDPNVFVAGDLVVSRRRGQQDAHRPRCDGGGGAPKGG